MTKLLNPSIETLFAVLEQADWIKTLENNWIIFTSPPDEEGNTVDAVYPLEEGIGSGYRVMMEYELEQLGLIELAKPDANGWYRTTDEGLLVDRQEYLVYDDLTNNIYFLRYRDGSDVVSDVPHPGEPWWDAPYTTYKYPCMFLYFQPLPAPPVGYPKPQDWEAK